MRLRSGFSPGQRLGLEAYLEGAEEVAAADAEKVHAKRKVRFRDCAPRGGCTCADRWSVWFDAVERRHTPAGTRLPCVGDSFVYCVHLGTVSSRFIFLFQLLMPFPFLFPFPFPYPFLFSGRKSRSSRKRNRRRQQANNASCCEPRRRASTASGACSDAPPLKPSATAHTSRGTNNLEIGVGK